MGISKNIRSGKRFGARYGPRLRNKVAEIEALKRSSKKCPSCGKDAVKRVAMGIWHCHSCEATFAGKAYTFTKKKSLKQLQEEITAREAAEAAAELKERETAEE